MLPSPVHSTAFRVRRALNWFPLGLAYAFLYMGRYNLTVAKNALGELMTKAEFGQIFGFGAIVYGCSFIVNGPLTDRIGGRRTMLIGVAGAILANVLMGLAVMAASEGLLQVRVASVLLVLYALNMYFQSFGAVAIVTVKAPWFHVRERGSFSTLFGIMIAMGVYFAFDWGEAIVAGTRGAATEGLTGIAALVRASGLGGRGVDENEWLFFIPASILSVLWIVLFIWLRDMPSHAGFQDFDTGEGAMSESGERLPVKVIFLKLLKHPVLQIVCLIEFSSGVLRNGVMHWYTFFAKETGFYGEFFITRNWGLMLLSAGVLGSVLTGWASDRFFQSRRAPMAGILYVGMVLGTIGMCLGLTHDRWIVGGCALLVSMSVIGVHGIMSGTSTVDFGGTKNGGAAVGIVDGLVYLGTAVQSLAAGYMTPTGPLARDPANWFGWPLFLVPFALSGVWLSMRIWHALPRRSAAPRVMEAAPAPQVAGAGEQAV